MFPNLYFNENKIFISQKHKEEKIRFVLVKNIDNHILIKIEDVIDSLKILNLFFQDLNFEVVNLMFIVRNVYNFEVMVEDSVNIEERNFIQVENVFGVIEQDYFIYKENLDV